MHDLDVGASDQGIIGYASDEETISFTHLMATRLGKKLNDVPKNGDRWHLGVILSRTDHMGQEVAARIKNMHVHYHPLARNVFLSVHLGEVVKSSVAKSLLWSVLFRGAGTWGHIGTCWIKKLEAARVYVLRAMYGNFRGAGDGVMTDVQVLAKARLLPVQLQLRIERTKCAARLFGKALRSSDGWRRMKTVMTQIRGTDS